MNLNCFKYGLGKAKTSHILQCQLHVMLRLVSIFIFPRFLFRTIVIVYENFFVDPYFFETFPFYSSRTEIFILPQDHTEKSAAFDYSET